MWIIIGCPRVSVIRSELWMMMNIGTSILIVRKGENQENLWRFLKIIWTRGNKTWRSGVPPKALCPTFPSQVMSAADDGGWLHRGWLRPLTLDR
eukprot:UN25450